jgi:hypothetical protein
MQQRQAIDFCLLGKSRTSFLMLKHILHSFYLVVGVANVSVSGGADYPAVLRRHPPRNEIAWVVYTAYSFFISSSEISANYVSSLLAENQSVPNQQTSNNNARYQIAIYSQGFRLSS